MIAVRAFVLGLREVLTLEQAEARARSIDDVERSRLRDRVAAVRLRRDASRRLSHPIPAIVLLRDALALAGETVAEEAPAPAVDDLDFAHAETLRAELESRVASWLAEIDTRSPFAIRVARLARLAGVALAVTFVTLSYVHKHFMVHDLALGTTVRTSPLRGDSPTPDHVVDGHTHGTFGVQTTDSAHPFVTVDLGAEHTIDHVVVYNRGDGWFDECLPIEVEVSSDGLHFDTIGRRKEHFMRWSVDAGERRARFVRVSKPDRGYLALNAIQVFGR